VIGGPPGANESRKPDSLEELCDTAWIAFSDEITSGHTMAIQWSISGLKIRASRLLNLEERFLLYGSSSPVG
jgi:hypothetical protein